VLHQCRFEERVREMPPTWKMPGAIISSASMAIACSRARNSTFFLIFVLLKED
jgi:hypothetical protein